MPSIFLSDCIGATPPPVSNNKCWLTGGGTIKAGRGQPVFTFAGVINPGCNGKAPKGGSWTVVAHAAKLQFKAVHIDVLNCGNLPNVPPGSRSPKTPFNYIDFQGVGTLKGIAGSHADYGLVQFSARACDLGEPGKNDRLYLRIYDKQ